MKYLFFFLKDKENKFEKEKEELINHYLKSLIRYENNLNHMSTLLSPFFSNIYINDNLFNLLTKINKIKSEEEENKRNIILKFLLNHQLNYDDFETSFLQYFKINNNDYDIIKEFVKPFYKEKITINGKNKNILKILNHIFLFHISYIQFYMIVHEFLEISEKEMEYFIHLFIYQNEKDNKEKMRLLQKELKYEYFDFYINQLFKIFYLTIHLLKDITHIIYDFDIHNIFLLKKEWLNKIFIK